MYYNCFKISNIKLHCFKKIGRFLQTDIVKDIEGYFEDISNKKHTTLESKMARFSSK